jgi:hypothetical protein
VFKFEFDIVLSICNNKSKFSHALCVRNDIVILHVCELPSIALRLNATNMASSKIRSDVHESFILWTSRRYSKVHFARQGTRTRESGFFSSLQHNVIV